MCGRYALGLTLGNLSDRFLADFHESANYEPNQNVSPGTYNPVITRNSPNQIQIMKWGFIPSWAKDPKTGFKMINARVETVNTNYNFKEAFLNRRCLVPVTGFYEWKQEGKKKIPYFFGLDNSEVFALAGVYSVWKDAENKEIKTYLIITAPAEGKVAEIHDRMPVMLSKESESGWLNNDLDVNEVMEVTKGRINNECLYAQEAETLSKN